MTVTLRGGCSGGSVVRFCLGGICFVGKCCNVRTTYRNCFGYRLSSLSLSRATFLYTVPGDPACCSPVGGGSRALAHHGLVLGGLERSNGVARRRCRATVGRRVALGVPRGSSAIGCGCISACTCCYTAETLVRGRNFGFGCCFSSSSRRGRCSTSCSRVCSCYRGGLCSSNCGVCASVSLAVRRRLRSSVSLALLSFASAASSNAFGLRDTTAYVSGSANRIITVINKQDRSTIDRALGHTFRDRHRPKDSVGPLVICAPSFRHNGAPSAVMGSRGFSKKPSGSNSSCCNSIAVEFTIRGSLGAMT